MPPDQSTSITLLQRLRENNQAAWQRLHHLYMPLVEHWCRRWGIPGADIDDVSQEVFQAVASGLSGFRREHAGDTFRGWLRGITRYKVLDHFRRGARYPEAAGGSDAHQRIMQVPEPDGDNDEDEADAVSGLFHRALDQVRGEFEDRTWQAFWRVVIDGQTPADVAREMGVSPAGVRQSKSRVLRRLKQEVGDLID